MIPPSQMRLPQSDDSLYASFLKVNEAERVDKFFEITSSVDMFGCHTLSIEKGKRTAAPRSVIRGFDEEIEMRAEFVRLCKLRISHGYEIREIRAPGFLKSQVMNFLCNPKRQSEDFDRGNRMFRAAMNLIYRSLLDEEADHETLLAFRKKLNATDPQSKKDEPSFQDMLDEQYDTIRKKLAPDENIEIIRYFIDRFTTHDPRLRRSLTRALTTPQTIEGPNVVRMKSAADRQKRSFVLKVHVMEAFARESIYTKIPLKLVDCGIQRLEQLTHLSWDSLKERASLSFQEVTETDRVCGAFGLQLKSSCHSGPNSGANSTVCL